MIIDSFPFNKDFLALEIRLNELYDLVDLFIACESNVTHSGLRKPLYLSENEEFQKRFKKLKVLVKEKSYFVSNSRIREMLQRQHITKFLKELNLNQSDVIIHSDCDEIPRSSVIKNIIKSNESSNINFLLELDAFANKLNLYSGKWVRARVQSYKLFKSIQHMRQDIFIRDAIKQKRFTAPILRISDFYTTRRFGLHKIPINVRNYKPPIVVNNAGWHFNNLMPENEIIYKIENSSHIEWNTEIIRKNAINNFRTGRDIYTGEKMQVVQIDESFPLYVSNNKGYWKKFIFEENNPTIPAKNP